MKGAAVATQRTDVGNRIKQVLVGIEEQRRKESRTTADVLKLYSLRALINLVILVVLGGSLIVIWLVTATWAPEWLRDASCDEASLAADTTLAKVKHYYYTSRSGLA